MGERQASFGEVLRRLRGAAALSQEELAERSGLSKRGISDLERGARRAPWPETVRMLADALALDEHDRAVLLAAARPVAFAGATAAPASPTPASLPTPLTRLIGRDAEVASLCAELRREDARLVTIAGSGGVGKTRLAVAVADGLREVFPDGIAFVDLSPLAAPALVVPTIAAALGVRDVARRPLLETVAGFLATKRLLLILDNCERVLAAARDVTSLLAASPGLTVLATSREPFHVQGERQFPVPPLPLPDPERRWAVDELGQVAAVRLFVERAQAVQPDFGLTVENAAAVAAICRRLDGLPLAIELAAARTKVLPPAALLARLEPRLPLLIGGGQDLPARQRTMRDTIAWSYDLLAPEAQRLFRRLAVFVGGFTLPAAEAVAASRADDPVLDGVVALVEQSLVRRVPGVGLEPRFTMLETIREFGLERLHEGREAEKLQRRHAEFYATLAEEAEPSFLRMLPAQATWLVRLEAEHANLRAALGWLLEGGDAGLGLRLAAAIWWFWHMRGHLGEGRSWLERALAAVARPAPLDRAKALAGACLLTHYQGDEEQALALGEESLALFREIGDRAGTGRALCLLGVGPEDSGDYDRAAALFEEALALHRAEHDRAWTANALGHLGLATYGRGDLERAAALTEEALALNRDVGLPWGLTVSLVHAGVVACERGDYRRAAAVYAEALTLANEQGVLHGIARALVGVATLAAFRGRPEPAARLFGAADALYEALGYRYGLPERAQYDRARAATRRTLSGEGFATAWESGRALATEEAITEALTLTDGVVAAPVD